MIKFFAVLILCMVLTETADAATLDKATKTFLNKEFSAQIGEADTKVLGLGVIVFKDGAEVYSKFAGRSHVAPNKKMTRQTLFRAASLSKMFTIFSVMQLVEQGKIDLNADISDYLGFELRNPNFPNAPITIEMLASHTSSLRDGEIYSLPPQYSLKEFFTADGVAYEDGAHFSDKPNEAPGKYFQYSNLNYGILGTIIERVTGERFDLYQQNHILKQLGISGGYVVGNLSKKDFKNLGAIYQNIGGKWTAQIDDYKTQPQKNFIDVQNPYAPDAFGTCDVSNYQIGTNATIFAPQGGLRISFDDLSKSLQMLMNGGTYDGKQIISRESFDEMISSRWVFDEDNPNGNTYGSVMENYGLGLYKIGGSSRARLCRDYEIDLIGHSGEAFGLISGLYFLPETRDGVIFMINGTACEVGDELSFGDFGANYIWEENIMNPICQKIFAR